MITGTVSDDHAPLITLVVRNAAGVEYEFDAQIDTGFDGALILPPDVISRLGLSWRDQGRVTLADGSECEFGVYDGVVIWDGQPRAIDIDSSDIDPLIGLGLLAGHRLTVEFRPGGPVTVEALP